MGNGLSVASVLIAVLAALVVTVITLVNRIERQAGSILDHLTVTGAATRPLLDVVGETLADEVIPWAPAAGHLAATTRAAAGMEPLLDALAGGLTRKDREMLTTIYDEVGGAPAVEAVVEAFYRRLLADPDLLAYFEGRDMARLEAHQRALVTVALGGTSEEYTGRMMHPAHAGMAITDEAFDKVLDHLLAVLTDAGVPTATSAKVLAILQPLRTDVVQSPMAVVR